MSTDFYERQALARRSTKWLIAAFALGVAAIVATVFVVTSIGMGAWDASSAPRDRGQPVGERWFVPLAASGAACGLVLLGSLYKIAQLRGGGTVVAEGLGGRRVYPNTTDPVEKRLLNVVEEMGLASGVPVPAVYLLAEEEGINAFAAGYTPSDAVVAVTRGTAEQLTRDQLQGVVAHEFSHILNGDMRLNIRMIGVLHGILLLGLVGRILLHSMSYRRHRSRSDSGSQGVAYLLILAVVLLILGAIGTLIGGLIKAAVSRQREYLADSSAVQFTRNPTGLAGALKRIGSLVVGSRLQHANAAEASHLYFAAGIREGWTALTSTHPPLAARILRLEPSWNGTFPPPATTPAAYLELGGAASGLVSADAPLLAPTVKAVSEAADQVGHPTEDHRHYAALLLRELPPSVAAAARDPYAARAVVFCLLLDRDPTVRQHQSARLRETAAADIVALTARLAPDVDAVDLRARLPLVDLTLPALRAMSTSQYQDFQRCFRELARADESLALFEWTLFQVLLRHLRPQYERQTDRRTQFHSLRKFSSPCSVLLSALARVDARHEQAQHALSKAAEQLPELRLTLLSPAACRLEALQQALEQLASVGAKHRRRLIDACAACICADRDITIREVELLRGVSDLLDCPMPPLLPGQAVE